MISEHGVHAAGAEYIDDVIRKMPASASICSGHAANPLFVRIEPATAVLMTLRR
jgi:hypothetical protein